jgi:hypothetical protein
MNSTFEITLAVVAGVALGAAAVQGLHAQAKPKAWSVSELETLDAAARTAFVPVVQAAQKAAGARIFNTGGGRIVASEGAAPPPECGHHRVGQPGAGAGILQLESLERPYAAA